MARLFWQRHPKASRARIVAIRSACQPAPSGSRCRGRCGCSCAGVGELAGDGLRLVAPVVAVLADVIELRTQQFCRVTQRFDLPFDARCTRHCLSASPGPWMGQGRPRNTGGLVLPAQRGMPGRGPRIAPKVPGWQKTTSSQHFISIKAYFKNG